MSIGSLLIILVSFLACIIFVLVVTYLSVRNQQTDTNDGFFLGGRSFTGFFIAGSLILTNLSATSFLGMSAQAYIGNMSVMGWEVNSGIALVLIALFLVPRYLKQGITTVPDFLEDRYNSKVKMLSTFLYLFEYIANLLPITLYGGALVINGVFNIQGIFGLSKFEALAIICALIGVLSFFYAIYGGLKAIVISDTINGFILLFGGLLVPVLGLLALGHGNLFQGWHVITNIAPQKMLSISSNPNRSANELPFNTMFTGLLLVNLYYWGTDQAIVQRILGAKNLKEGQKGTIYAGSIKTITPFFLILPGIIAWHLFTHHTTNIHVADTIYVSLVNRVLPTPLIGIFIAGMFGSILSVCNGMLNSISTLFALNVYEPLSKKTHSERQLVAIGRIFGVLVMIAAVVIAPFIMYASSGIFDYLQKLYGVASVPIFTILVVGYFSKRIPTIAAIVGLIFFVIAYSFIQFTPATYASYFGILEPFYHMFFLDQLAILFVITVVIMFIIGKIHPRETAYQIPPSGKVEMKPWGLRFEASLVVLYMVIGAYLSLSKVGFVDANKTFLGAYVICGIIMIAGIIASFMKKRRNGSLE